MRPHEVRHGEFRLFAPRRAVPSTARALAAVPVEEVGDVSPDASRGELLASWLSGCGWGHAAIFVRTQVIGVHGHDDNRTITS